jgi:gas vesicle protein
MSKNEKIAAGILIGAAAGFAAAMFLDTERGKKLLEDIKQLASETFDDALARLVKLEQKYNEQLVIDDTDEEV